jgi:vacuolar-type H+-ATPase subunit E/Vma4
LEVQENIEEKIESKEESKQKEFKSEKVSAEKLSISDVAYSAGQERINEWKNNIKIMFGGVGDKVSNILEKTKRYSVMAMGAPESIKYTKEEAYRKDAKLREK